MDEEECIGRGGHFWNYHTGHDIINEYGVADSKSARLVLNKRPSNYRKCGLCLTHEVEIPAQWKKQTSEKMMTKTKFGEWQPIETAPKDGSRFLSYALRVDICWFEKTINDFVLGGYQESDGTRTPASKVVTLKYWMPYPKPPKGDE